MKKLLMLLIICSTIHTTSVRIVEPLPYFVNPQAFNTLEEYYRFKSVQNKHGSVALATDYSHFIRLNGERVENKGRW